MYDCRLASLRMFTWAKSRICYTQTPHGLTSPCMHVCAYTCHNRNQGSSSMASPKSKPLQTDYTGSAPFDIFFKLTILLHLTLHQRLYGVLGIAVLTGSVHFVVQCLGSFRRKIGDSCMKVPGDHPRKSSIYVSV